jgi:hypothetical protein
VKTVHESTQKRAKPVLGGRPPKFREPSRPITVTLPERVLRELASMNSDRACAIVKCVDAVLGKDEDSTEPVRLVKVAPGKALIVVGPTRSLHKIAWLRLVEIAPAKYILAIPSGTSVDSLEVAILDLLEGLDPDDTQERNLLEKLQNIIGQQRRNKTVSKAELVFVDV